jgi:hypothetical protein
MEAAKNKEPLVVQLTVEELSEIVREAIISAMKASPGEDKLLKAEEVCKILNVSDPSSEKSVACCDSATTASNDISRAQSFR